MLRAEAARYGLDSYSLPASKGLVAHVVHTELARALHEGSGSQGGATVGSSFRDGFLFLQGVGLPIDARQRPARRGGGAAYGPAGGQAALGQPAGDRFVEADARAAGH